MHQNQNARRTRRLLVAVAAITALGVSPDPAAAGTGSTPASYPGTADSKERWIEPLIAGCVDRRIDRQLPADVLDRSIPAHRGACVAEVTGIDGSA